MTVDLYGAWLTAGNNLQPIGDWLARNWIWLTAVALAAAFAWRALRRELRDANDHVTAILADQRQPDTDSGLHLNYIATYGDREDLGLLRDAITDHRTGEK